MTLQWYEKAMKSWKNCLFVANIKTGFVILTLIFVVFTRWNGDEDASSLKNASHLIWACLLMVWAYFSSTTVYVTYAYFESLCFYFTIRFRKVFTFMNLLILIIVCLTFMNLLVLIIVCLTFMNLLVLVIVCFIFTNLKI